MEAELSITNVVFLLGCEFVFFNIESSSTAIAAWNE